MKIQIAVICSILIVISISERTPYQLPPKVTEAILQGAAQCFPETNVPNELWDAIKNDTLEYNETFKKFLFCIMSKLEFIDDQGHPITSKLHEVFQEDEYKKVIDNCASKGEGDTPMETAYIFYKCCKDNTNIHIAL